MGREKLLNIAEVLAYSRLPQLAAKKLISYRIPEQKPNAIIPNTSVETDTEEL